jgi:hypothetical protein
VNPWVVIAVLCFVGAFVALKLGSALVWLGFLVATVLAW